MDYSSVVPVECKADEGAIRCICGLDYDDGFSIACDNCSRWCHAACFGIVDTGVPEEWKCWICQPRQIDRDVTERLQRTRISRLRDVDKLSTRRPHDDEELRPYVIVNDISKGNLATVYKAYHKGTHQQVAIKAVATGKLSSKRFNNLQNEIQILKSLSHRHIARLLDIIHAEENVYFIMEFCAGGDLKNYIRQRGRVKELRYIPSPGAAPQDYPHPPIGGLDETVVRSFLRQLARAIKFLRVQNLIHRDIEPGNLLLHPAHPDELTRGHPLGVPILKVADFGSARSLPDAAMAETLCGSPLYMAPEILRYEKYDAKVDLWSVGVVLYEIAVGKPPFRANNHLELLRTIEDSRSIKFPDEDLPPGTPNGTSEEPQVVAADIKQVIRALLKKRPVERASFVEFFSSRAMAKSRFPRPKGLETRSTHSSAADEVKNVGTTLIPGETDDDELLRDEYVLVDDSMAVEFNRTVDGNSLPDTHNPIDGGNNIISPPIPHVVAPPPSSSSLSTAHRAAPNPLHRALTIASKKLLGASRQHLHLHSPVTGPPTRPLDPSSIKEEKIKEINPLELKKRPLNPFSAPAMSAVDSFLSPSASFIQSGCRFLILQILKDRDQQAQICNLSGDDAQTIVDYLDILSHETDVLEVDERRRVLSLLCKLAKSTRLFPRCYMLSGIEHTQDTVAGGSFADVWKGKYGDKELCLKVVRVYRKQESDNILRELALWAHLSHENILPFYGVYLFDTPAPRICLVSPWMQKGNLHDYLDEYRQKPRLPFISDIVNGLAYLHGLQIVHSDLKAQNVLVSEDERALITDFGLSSVVSTTTLTSTGGTTRFMPPELVIGEGKVTKSCDIWSFACLCYEILTNKLPFYQYKNTQMFTVMMRREIPRLPEKAGGEDGESSKELDDKVWKLLVRCWNYESRDRPECEAIQEALKDIGFRDGRPEATTDIETGSSFWRAMREKSDNKVDCGRVADILLPIYLQQPPAQDPG